MSYSFSRTLVSLFSNRFVQAVLLTASLAVYITPTPSSAAQLANGQSVFDHAPRLIGASTTQPNSAVSGGMIEFTLTIPQDAGAPLKAVTISPPTNGAKIVFADDRSQVMANGVTVPISSIGGNDENGVVTIPFEHPIQPGATVTISLLVQQNAGMEGNYSFGVTAFSENDVLTNGLFLGYAHVKLLSPGS
jgi:hypothetical protein